ncbi:MAG: rhomboid family intramembrane serine protease [Terracidiphilus sp.]|jgi:rhomboid protease GluP
MAPQEPVRRERAWWASAPATYLLVGINCAVFLWMLYRHVSYLNPSPDQLMAFGANNAGAVLINGDWFRIVSAMFVHVGIIHLATNMWCLWNLGMLAEPLMGSAGVLAVYILTGAAGNLLSVFVTRVWFFDPNAVVGGWFGPVGAGASGAVFGIAGALIVLLKSHWLPVPPEELRKLRMSVVYFAGINLVIGLATMIPGSFVKIDNMAHMGGCACGLLFAAPMVPRIGAPKRLFFVRRRVAVGSVVLVLTLFAFFIASFHG